VHSEPGFSTPVVLSIEAGITLQEFRNVQAPGILEKFFATLLKNRSQSRLFDQKIEPAPCFAALPDGERIYLATPP